MPQYDALVLTLCIDGFDVHRVLMRRRFVATTRFQLNEAFPTNVKFGRTNPLWFQRRNNYDTGRYHTSCISRASHLVGFILSCRRLGAIQLHSKKGLAALDEGRPFNLSSNGKLFNQCGTG